MPAIIVWTVIVVALSVFAAKHSDKPVMLTLAAAVALVAFVRLLVVVIRALVARACNRYVFTSEVVATRTGLLSTHSSQVRLSDIRGVSVSQSLAGRIFGYSSADIGSAATAGAEIHIRDVRHLDAILARLEQFRVSAS